MFPVVIFLWGCSTPADQVLFSDITMESGVAFRNDLSFTEKINPYTYRNFYNGAGVGIGDINNDGLLDVYFAGNQVDNKLYLNEGNLLFKDITESAGVACAGVWSTGVTFVDINADGFLDIYVCKSGDPDVLHRYNELFINNHDLTFTEKSKEYGLDFIGLSVQASFFDYDKDGDLDCYLLTNSIRSIGNFDLVKDQREIRDTLGGGNKFLINDNGKFKDFSKASGIYSSAIGFGLGITLGDFNNDSWTDIFISNDFFERDYLYINNQKGSFTESLPSYFQSISMGSMGADFADLDNDGDPELFVTEMLPDSLNRKKSKTIFESWNKYQMNVENGYHYQFGRNVLQKKISKNTYAEVGRLAGIAASEWSWGALLFDMDNDGLKDIFIANGIYKDLLDRDYLTYTGTEINIRQMLKNKEDVVTKLIDLMPQSRFPNYAYKNEGNLNFTNMATNWGLGKAMYSSGSAYGDLDNDGDLDFVVSNINAPAVVYRNNTDTSKFKSITISLSAKEQNTSAIGAQVVVYCGNQIHLSDNFVTRGFQSSTQPKVQIGLGEGVDTIDSIYVRWPDKGLCKIYYVSTNQELHIKKEAASMYEGNQPVSHKNHDAFRLEFVSNSLFRHAGNGMIDFNRDRLLPMMYSNETPSLLRGDINLDGVEEIYVGGGKGQSGAFIQLRAGKFELSQSKALNKYSISEETKGTLFDADSDGDLDFYLAAGGRFFPESSSALTDVLLLNNGKGAFTESPNRLPFTDFVSTSVAKSIDFDRDGDNDLFIGVRFHPFVYGMGGRGYLFQNNGEALFTDVTKEFAPMLSNIGMVTDVSINDFNNDGWDDIIVVGDWMPITFLKNINKHFTSTNEELGLVNTEGWWHAIEAADLNHDGNTDFVVANHGRNTFFRPGDRVYVSDFDKNGSIEQIFCTKVNDKYYPIVDKDEFLTQFPSLKKDLLYYKDYSKRAIDELFKETTINTSKLYEAKILSSILLLSSGNSYKSVALPLEAQFSPIYSLLIKDFDNDGVEDLMAGGNQYQVKPQFGRYDASNGWLFKGSLNDGKFAFESGIDLHVKGQIRDIEFVKINGTKYIFFAKYDDDLEIYKIPD